MQTSQTRILTTHTGSLPRPAELVGSICGRTAANRWMRSSPRRARRAGPRRAQKQEAGIDVGNNGEQQREAFFLYVRNRMSGFGGAWTRLPRADVERYPAYKEAMAREQQPADGVQPRADPHGDRRRALRGPRRHRTGMQRFPRRARCAGQPLRRAVPHRAVARHRRRLAAKRPLSERDGIPRSPRRGAACRIRDHRQSWLPAAARLPGPRNGTAHLLSAKTSQRLPGLCRSCGCHHQRGTRQHPAREGPPARLLGQLRGPARLRRGAAGDHAHPAQTQRRRLRAAVRQPAPCTRICRAEGLPARRTRSSSPA